MRQFKRHLSFNEYGKVKIVMLLALAIAILGISFRIYSETKLESSTEHLANVNVVTIIAKATPTTETLVLPGNVQAWHEATIFARTNGYVKKWKTDIGARVKQGDLLALIETPELVAQLRQAEADLKTAEANNQLAQSTAIRWKALLKTDSVSKQETDEKVSDAIAKAATVNSLRANRDHLLELLSFNKILAPFDGVITSRTVDVGTLVSEGSTTQQPLFHIVQADPLRVYVQIPQNYAGRIKKDMTVDLKFAEHPKQSYQAKLLETAKAIEPTSRTLLAQFSIANPKYELLSGGYTTVHLSFASEKGNVILPVNALLFQAHGLQVALLDKHGIVTLRKVTIGKDLGNFVEIVNGVNPGDTVVNNPPDSLRTNQKVTVIHPEDNKE